MKEPLGFDTFEEINQAWKESKTLPDADRKEFQSFLRYKLSKEMETHDKPMESEGPLDEIAKGGLKALNYGASLVQAPGLYGAAKLTGHPEVASDVLESLKPWTNRPSPTPAEVAEKIGIPPGPSFSDLPGLKNLYSESGEGLPLKKGGFFDPTVRGAAATGVDLVASPGGIKSILGLGGDAERAALKGLTAERIAAVQKDKSLAAMLPPAIKDKILSMASTVTDPLDAGLKGAGKKLYESAFTDADRTASRFGPNVSDVMYRNNAWGSAKSLEDQAEMIKSRLANRVREKTQEGFSLTPNANYSRSEIMSRAEQNLGDAKKVGGQAAGADKALGKIRSEFDDAYGIIPTAEAEGTATGKNSFNLNELNDLKRSYQNKASVQRAYLDEPPSPARGFRAADNATEAKLLGEGYEAVAQRARRAGEDILDRAKPGLGGEVFLDNQDIGALRGGQKDFARQAKENFGQTVRKSGPAAIVTGAMGAVPTYMLAHENPALAIGMGAAGALMTTDAARTGTGLLLRKSSPYLSNGVRSYLQQTYAPGARQPSPWDLLNEEMRNSK